MNTPRLNTKIICTIGPASESREMIQALIRAGMNVARLNMSHGDHETHQRTVSTIREIAAEMQTPVGILVDLQGPKLRVGQLPPAGVALTAGELVRLCAADEEGHDDVVPVQFSRLPSSVSVGDRVLLDDGVLELRVEAIEAPVVTCQVVTGGVLMSHKGINLPRASQAIDAISPKDAQDLDFALAEGVDWIALSFVRRAAEVVALREMIAQRRPGQRSIPVIAKIEKPEAVEVIDEIIQVVDGIMVARGDLGIEMSPEAVPMVQKMIIDKCNRAGIPVITATQMLDSMIRNPRPTRAEASDVANAILDGTDAIMLSGETAVGKYPVQTVETMKRIARQTESHAPAKQIALDALPALSNSQAVCHAAVDIATIVHARAILAPTISGSTARTLSRFRSPSSIVAITPDDAVRGMLTLYWGVHPLLSQRAADTDTVIRDVVDAAMTAGLAKAGDTVVVTAGTGGHEPGITDLIKVITL